MGECKYCGEQAGFLRQKHKECEIAHQLKQERINEGKEKIISIIQSEITGNGDWVSLGSEIERIEEEYGIDATDRRAILVKAWEGSVELFLEDGILDEIEEKKLFGFMKKYGLNQDDLDLNGMYMKTVKAATIRDILNGKLPKRVSFTTTLPINLQKGENVIWAFPDTKYLEDKTRRQTVGGSKGFNVRIAKGVYYRTGQFRGTSMEYTERVHVDSGIVVITTKHIYFHGPRKPIRIPYNKIVSFQPMSDGIGIMKDTATAKPQYFMVGDGWFIYNLVANLSQIEVQ